MKSFLTIIALFFLMSNSYSAQNPLNEKIASIIQKAGIPKKDIGLYAITMPGKAVLANLNKDEPLNPASCIKLVTTAAALRVLGPNYTFPTKFFTESKNPKNLWIRGYGDPSFVIERLEETATSLIKNGLVTIEGDIIFDDTYFDEPSFPGRQKGSPRSYNALTSAIALNHNSITVEVSPANKVGQPAIVKTDAPGFAVQNLSKTIGATKKTRPRNLIRIVKTKNGNTIKVTGTVHIGACSKTQYFNINNPPRHFAEVLKTLLIEKGVLVRGTVKEGIVPPNARLFYKASSAPLSEIIKDMNKHSSNFMAEQIIKTIGAKAENEPCTTKKGLTTVEKYLSGLGIQNFYIENGSGLSYNNKMTPHDIVKVMLDIYSDPKLRNIYIDSLSIAGVDGTIKKMDSPILYNRLKAKTGSLNGVSTLSGFVPDSNNIIIFSIMINNNRLNFWKGRDLGEQIVEALLRK